MTFNSSQYQYFLFDKDMFEFNGSKDFSVDFDYTNDQRLNSIKNFFLDKEDPSITIICKLNISEFKIFIEQVLECNSKLKNLNILKKIQEIKFGEHSIINNPNHYKNNLTINPNNGNEYILKFNNDSNIKYWSFRQKTKDSKLSIGLQNVLNMPNNILNSDYKDLLGIFYSLIFPFFKSRVKFEKATLDTNGQSEIVYSLAFDFINKNFFDEISKYNPNIKFNTINNLNPPLNLLLKGVPGTGKSLLIDNLIKKIGINNKEQVLRVNIHSGTNNSDLMQGIGIKTNMNNNIIYQEKQGVVLSHLINAIIYYPQPYVLILEEIQENSLNKIIGDLIYLIEPTKRTSIPQGYYGQITQYNVFNTIDNLIKTNMVKDYVKMPSLVEIENSKNLIIPDNFYLFCTSNYRDDKKVIEDNLLRRFDVIELYPNPTIIGNTDVRKFFENLNLAIEDIMKDLDTHPDRYTIGHANWINESNITKPFLKAIIDFKDVKNLDFSTTYKILSKLSEQDTNYIIKEKSLSDFGSYKELIIHLQEEVYKDILKENASKTN